LSQLGFSVNTFTSRTFFNAVRLTHAKPTPSHEDQKGVVLWAKNGFD
jgi:hypothetical protein